MAGAGRKTFTRQTLASADVQNYLMDQAVMRFASASARNTAIPTPTEGMVATLDDTNQTLRHDGTAWRPVSRSSGGLVTVQTDVNGLLAITHGLGAAPTWCLAVPAKQATSALDAVIKVLMWPDPVPSSTVFYVRAYRHDGTNGVASPFQTTLSVYWAAGLD